MTATRMFSVTVELPVDLELGEGEEPTADQILAAVSDEYGYMSGNALLVDWVEVFEVTEP